MIGPCVLCGTPGARTALVRWEGAPDSARFGAIVRCPDAAACRQRVEAEGRSWLAFMDAPPPSTPPGQRVTDELAAIFGADAR